MAEKSTKTGPPNHFSAKIHLVGYILGSTIGSLCQNQSFCGPDFGKVICQNCPLPTIMHMHTWLHGHGVVNLLLQLASYGCPYICECLCEKPPG